MLVGNDIVRIVGADSVITERAERLALEVEAGHGAVPPGWSRGTLASTPVMSDCRIGRSTPR